MIKKILFFVFALPLFVVAQQQNITYSVTPSVFEENESITITVNGNSLDESLWGVTNNELYIWSWSFDLNLDNIQNCPTNGDWTDSSNSSNPTANRFTYNPGPDTYTISFVPNTFYARTGIGRIGFLVKAKNGTGDKKSQDNLVNVGAFQVALTAPAQGSTTIVNSGGSLAITANNTGGNATYVLKANGTTINTQTNTTSYSYSDTNITQNKEYSLEVTYLGVTKTKTFSALVDPGSSFQVLSGSFVDGINYDPADPTKATLLLYAEGKDFVYVAGSFNNYQPNSSYAMKRDPSRNNRFWITLTGLTPGEIETFQYWVVDKTPVSNSPKLVKTADPYSKLVLSPFDDPFISATTYPNLPAYPAGQQREVTVLQTNQTAYNWQVTNFVKPKKEDLVIYEVLVRDFDTDRNYQNLIDRIQYFKNLNINAIQLMPVMEFEGNESWGYNTSFHMATDKFYGTQNKLKEFIDVCHQNGIAVILDVALNHAFGRNPMVRMWMDDPDNDGWGEPSNENPYFNQVARHSYSVGSDFDHSNSFTKIYTKRVIEHWVNEFKVDGFRWDLTKGFTQNCSASNEACTNGYQADRVAVLQEYASYSWSLDPTHYVIFEHLGTDGEEQAWANFRVNGESDGIPKGVMMWGKMTDQYNQLTLGYASNSDFNRMGHVSRGFSQKRLVGYAESHDEERLMYKNLQFGNTSNSSHNVTNLNVALSRMSALGAVSLTIPGPKMIWHFGALGMENSIFTCNNGTVNDPSGSNGDCKLDTKPQPQWTNNWLGDAQRAKIYNDWSRINALKTFEDVFEGNYTINSGNLTPKIYINNPALSSSSLKDVVIIANFNVVSENIQPFFPYAGNWYDLMDVTGSTVLNVTNTSDAITLAPGEFRIYGNEQQSLGVTSNTIKPEFRLIPNPAKSSFTLNSKVESVEIYSITGKLVKQFKNQLNADYNYNIEELSQGMYLVKVSNNDTTISLKLIKN